MENLIYDEGLLARFQMICKRYYSAGKEIDVKKSILSQKFRETTFFSDFFFLKVLSRKKG